MGWVDGADELPLTRQCELAEVPRATVYRRLSAKIPEEAGAEDLLLCRLIDEEYTNRPFYGSRRMVVFLRAAGHVVNRKRVQRLMRGMGLAGMAPGPNTSPCCRCGSAPRMRSRYRRLSELIVVVAIGGKNDVYNVDCRTRPTISCVVPFACLAAAIIVSFVPNRYPCAEAVIIARPVQTNRITRYTLPSILHSDKAFPLARLAFHLRHSDGRRTNHCR
jgi:hypothetical protein